MALDSGFKQLTRVPYSHSEGFHILAWAFQAPRKYQRSLRTTRKVCQPWIQSHTETDTDECSLKMKIARCVGPR